MRARVWRYKILLFSSVGFPNYLNSSGLIFDNLFHLVDDKPARFNLTYTLGITCNHHSGQNYFDRITMVKNDQASLTELLDKFEEITAVVGLPEIATR